MTILSALERNLCKPSVAAGMATMLMAAPTPLACAKAEPDTAPKSAGFTGVARTGFDFRQTDKQENIVVLGKRSAFQDAPAMNYGKDRDPWETGTAIHDTMTGANTAAFGNAYNLGSPMGSDERSNETGGQYVAPRHHE
jgi:hypothetical protein